MVDRLTPLCWALGYTLVFPIAQAGFYYVTLQYKTPLLQERANEILRENADFSSFPSSISGMHTEAKIK